MTTAYLTKDANGELIVEAVRRAARGDLLIPVELFARAIARRRDFAKAEDERASLRAEFTPGELDVLQLLARRLEHNPNVSSPRTPSNGMFAT